MIADRSFLADQLKDLQLKLDELGGWTDNPARPFPGDAVVLAERLQWIALLLLADDDMPEPPK